jgi:hypothetical protein
LLCAGVEQLRVMARTERESTVMLREMADGRVGTELLKRIAEQNDFLTSLTVPCPTQQLTAVERRLPRSMLH